MDPTPTYLKILIEATLKYKISVDKHYGNNCSSKNEPPRWSSSPRMSRRTAYSRLESLTGLETSPTATPAAELDTGTPASRSARVPPQTDAIDEEPVKHETRVWLILLTDFTPMESNLTLSNYQTYNDSGLLTRRCLRPKSKFVSNFSTHLNQSCQTPINLLEEWMALDIVMSSRASSQPLKG